MQLFSAIGLSERMPAGLNTAMLQVFGNDRRIQEHFLSLWLGYSVSLAKSARALFFNSPDSGEPILPSNALYSLD
jgi:hypothetical protein